MTAVLTVVACAAWLGYAFLGALVTSIEGTGAGNDQLAIAVAGVLAIGLSAWLATRQRRLAATAVLLLAVVAFVGWALLVL